MRINIGCGQAPTEGWRNFDNSLSLRLSKIPGLAYLLFKTGILESGQYEFIEFARSHRVEYADAVRRLPLSEGTVEVLYSSHMLEHLDQTGAGLFLREARRVLISGGIIRFAVPDLGILIRRYLESGDADEFLSASYLARTETGNIATRLRELLVGNRYHRWMYDGGSLSKLLLSHGFLDPEIMPPGETRIKNPGRLNLKERFPESVYIEAVSP